MEVFGIHQASAERASQYNAQFYENITHEKDITHDDL
jgi:hypothetical protein